jgi:hypothetical protein
MLSHSYNSVVYASVGANNYNVFLVNQTFIDPRHANLSSSELMFVREDDVLLLGHLQKSALAGTLDKLDNEQCIRSYGTMFLSNRSNLLLVASGNYRDLITETFVWNEAIDISNADCAVDPVPWICPRSDCKVACVNRLNEVLVEPQNWTVRGSTEDEVRVGYCLSQPTEEFCKLQFSLPITMVIILFNFFEALIMLILAFGLREARVQTMGDAIVSFLIQPDHIVNGRCLYSASDFKLAGLSGNPRDLIFTKKSMRFAETGERRVWILTYIL